VSAARRAGRAAPAPAVTRTLVVWCDQWPVVAAGVQPGDAVGIVDAGVVVAVTPAAAGLGVAPGQRRREAQGRCPSIELRPLDDRLLATAFEPVVATVSAFTPRVAMDRPGDCSLGTRGPARYFGGELALVAAVGAAVDEVLAPLGWGGWGRVVVADGPDATRVAARWLDRLDPTTFVPADAQVGHDARRAVVAPGATAAALAGLPVAAVVGDPALAGLLARLGLGTVGAFAALDPGDVLARFGTPGAVAHAVARGEVGHGAPGPAPPPELMVATTIDPPAERADVVAFAARPLADEFHRRLEARGATTPVVTVELESEHGEVSWRQWRHDGTPGGLVDRVRWQVEGWLSGPTAARPTAGVLRLRLVPTDVVGASGRQLGLWGGQAEADRRALRAASRIDALVGPGTVLVPRPAGGRGPAEQVVGVPVAEAAASDAPVSGGGRGGAGGGAQRGGVRSDPAPWPGAVPAPPPALVHDPPLPAEVLDATGAAVVVDGRHRLSAPPARVVVGGYASAVVAWAGPWPADERWWDAAAHRRRARLQLCREGGSPVLVAREGGRWWCEATYD
jgi:protein ImuB